MKRWNGWGEETVNLELPAAALDHLAGEIGPASEPVDADRRTWMDKVPRSRLEGHHAVDTDPDSRLKHAFGHSAADWITLRGGLDAGVPDGISRPLDSDQAAELLTWAAGRGVMVIPYGGGTAVAGQLSVDRDGPPCLSLSLERMNRLLSLEPESGLARFQAGIRGPDLEAALRAHGLTLGHFPQSFEYSTLGGWIACRSVGQFSLGYGRMDSLFAGGRIQTPGGAWDLPPFPASAAGPDLRQVVLGSEGRLGVITEADIRVSPLPEREVFKGAFFPDPDRAVDAVRRLAQTNHCLAMIRLSLPAETRVSLALAGNGRSAALLDRYLSLRGLGETACLLIYGASGEAMAVSQAMNRAARLIRRQGGVSVGRAPGRQWLKNRFRAPYMRNSLWRAGYGVDTMETALPWSGVRQAAAGLEKELGRVLEEWNEKVLVFSHLSHVYPHGSSLYLTCIFRLTTDGPGGGDPAATLERWRKLKEKASRLITGSGGTISHQHGVGMDHAPWLEREKGSTGMELLRAINTTVDPGGMMNPGKLTGPED